MICTKAGYFPFRFSRKNPFTIENIKLWIILKNKDFELVSNNFNRVIANDLIFFCKICEKTWTSSWNNIFKDRDCPNCLLSVGERNIQKYLEKHKIECICQKRFQDCKDRRQMPFDFYIPEYNCCIEYQGIQHYESINFGGWNKEQANIEFEEIKKRDNIKKEYCLNNNIKLIEISYVDMDKIDSILDIFLNKNF